MKKVILDLVSDDADDVHLAHLVYEDVADHDDEPDVGLVVADLLGA